MSESGQGGGEDFRARRWGEASWAGKRRHSRLGVGDTGDLSDRRVSRTGGSSEKMRRRDVAILGQPHSP